MFVVTHNINLGNMHWENIYWSTPWNLLGIFKTILFDGNCTDVLQDNFQGKWEKKWCGIFKFSTVWTPFVPKVLLVAENTAIRFTMGFDLSLIVRMESMLLCMIKMFECSLQECSQGMETCDIDLREDGKTTFCTG